MLDRDLILCGVPAGLVLGIAVWLSAGRGGASAEALDRVAGQLQTMRPTARRAGAGVPPALTAALFAAPEGAAVPVETSVALQGLTRTARRQAALLSIGGRPADWLAVGETRDGVTLDNVGPSGVSITTPMGSRDIGFGSPSATPTSPPTNDSGPPPGLRSPPPPASAPGAS